MEHTTEDKLMNDLALALIYLTAWKEKGDKIFRAWKGYDFSILDQLKEQGLIDFSYKAKSLYLSGEGEEYHNPLIPFFVPAFVILLVLLLMNMVLKIRLFGC